MSFIKAHPKKAELKKAIKESFNRDPVEPYSNRKKQPKKMNKEELENLYDNMHKRR